MSSGLVEELIELEDWELIGPPQSHKGRRPASAVVELALLVFLLLGGGEQHRTDAVTDALSELEREPAIGHQLRGRIAGLRSYRVGVYRIIYELRDERTVRVVAIRHRDDAYGSDQR